MGEHWGLPSIGARMGVSGATVLAWRERRGFPLYRRRRGARWLWYTNDGLIALWLATRSPDPVTPCS